MPVWQRQVKDLSLRPVLSTFEFYASQSHIIRSYLKNNNKKTKTKVKYTGGRHIYSQYDTWGLLFQTTVLTWDSEGKNQRERSMVGHGGRAAADLRAQHLSSGGFSGVPSHCQASGTEPLP